ncbi:hypothetical protein F1188_19915 [Roseospira marina]|uniref:BrnT family toxin n=1 Tax=Roseospira marina TaxID=140057 RepID=A0A5M6I638_9PROT|nr:BrnT family toxin [Roseospira marina]KAA5603248.1 hypothetical protein F1188_19915 [Roseospira marina]MBB4316184.1 hypothetical protein [Roseospira marina]MBB5089383.1 hypothetical protein [Roseospira marina]
MVIVWDEPKRLSNLVKHGLDFAALTPDFFLGSLVVPAHSGRFKAMGRLDDATLAVVFARLGRDGLSVISMRPASRKECRLYEQATES